MRTKSIVVTDGQNGYSAYSFDSKQQITSDSFNDCEVISEIGVGSAIFSAICSYYCENNLLDWTHANARIIEYVRPVLKTNGATPVEIKISFSKIKMIKRKIALILVSCIGVMCVLAGISLFHSSLPLYGFGICFFSVPILSGISGALTRFLLQNNYNDADEVVSEIVLGCVAGTLTAIIFFASHWAVFNKSLGDALSSSSFISTDFRMVIIVTVIISFISGLAAESAFDKIRRIKIA